MSQLIATLRSVRIFEIAVFDVVITALALIPIVTRMGYEVWRAWVLALPLGVLFHALFGISTPLTDEFLENKWTPKTVMIIGLLAVGIFYPHT